MVRTKFVTGQEEVKRGLRKVSEYGEPYFVKFKKIIRMTKSSRGK
jgi:hypothetical protein